MLKVLMKCKEKIMAVKYTTSFTGTTILMAIYLKIVTMNFYIMFIIVLNRITSVLSDLFSLLMPIR